MHRSLTSSSRQGERRSLLPVLLVFVAFQIVAPLLLTEGAPCTGPSRSCTGKNSCQNFTEHKNTVDKYRNENCTKPQPQPYQLLDLLSQPKTSAIVGRRTDESVSPQFILINRCMEGCCDFYNNPTVEGTRWVEIILDSPSATRRRFWLGLTDHKECKCSEEEPVKKYEPILDICM